MENETGSVVEQPVVETPVQTAPDGQPQTTETPVEIPQYELPDGTKADAETLSKAWKENFMPDYTRKAQELAALKAKISTPKEEPSAPTTNPLDNPEWQPGDYNELSKAIEQKVWNQILESASAEDRQREERDAYVEREKQEVLALDKNADLNAVMAHAAKFSFSSLIPAYQNMKASQDAARIAVEQALKHIQARSNTPVGAPTAGSPAMTFPPDVKTGLEKARYILRNQS